MPEPNLPSFFDCLRETGVTAIAAHRGGPANGWPENAIETFEYTVSGVSTGPVFIEADIARTKDGVLVLMHDDTLDRTTTGTGPVAERSYAELRQLRLRDKAGRPTPHPVPTLADALQWAKGHAILELDIKKSVSLAEVAELVRVMGAERRVVIITYTIAQAMEVQSLLPAAMITASIEKPADLEALEKAGVPTNQVIAWTGTRSPDMALDQFLAAKGVESAFGTLGRADSWDMRIAASGNDIQYLAIARQGIELLATDRPLNVSAALASEPNYLEGSRECAASLSFVR
ncbi:MAG: glycerophosphodiester phosphodiesterase family protein [Alphaproteobacteria bacterium]|nr:glycerophosphodiester phosphodiesterase family protein [Alphaproteobacteria bacterium]